MTWTLLIYLMIGAALEWGVSSGAEDDPMTRNESLTVIFLWPVVFAAAFIWRSQKP